MFNLTDLTPDKIKSFHDDGVICIKSCIPDVWLSRIARAIDDDILNPGPFVHGYETSDGVGRFRGNLRTWETDPTFRAFCLSNEMGRIAAKILDSASIRLFYDQMFVKEPNTPNPTRWHNDQPYWPIKGYQNLSFWFSPDNVTSETGALQFVRGSHKWNKWFQPETFGATAAHEAYERNPDYISMPDIDADRSDYDIVSWDLAPGDVYVFHGLTVHGSSGNQSQTERRRGYTVRYCGDDISYDTRPGTNTNLRCEKHTHGASLSEPRYPEVWGS